MSLLKVLLFLLLSNSVLANDQSFIWYTTSANKEAQLNVALFLSSTCPHCQKTDAFFHEIEPANPWLHVQRNYINQDKAALTRFSVFLAEQKATDFAVPSVIFCDSRWVGFDSAKTTGKDLLHALKYCKQQLEEKGELTSTTVTVLKRWANANLMNSGITENPSAAYYLLVVSLLDALNPCALFTFAAFFAVFFMQKEGKDRLQSALLFIIAISLSHYFQQTQANAFFQLLTWLRIPLIFFGMYTLYLVHNCYKKQMANPRTILFWSFAFAFLVQSYQQTCVMNWSYTFEQWLHSQNLPQIHQGVLQLIYQAVYLLPFALILFFYMFLSRKRFLSELMPKMHMISLFFISTIALLLMVFPSLLTQFLLSALIVSALAVLGWGVSAYKESKEDLLK